MSKQDKIPQRQSRVQEDQDKDKHKDSNRVRRKNDSVPALLKIHCETVGEGKWEGEGVGGAGVVRHRAALVRYHRDSA